MTKELKTVQDVEMEVQTIIESIPTENTNRSAIISEAEACKNGISDILFASKKITTIVLCVSGKGILRASVLSSDEINIDHLAAFDGAGSELIEELKKKAKGMNAVKITLCAAGNGDTLDAKDKSQKKLIEYYKTKGFTQESSTGGRMFCNIYNLKERL